MDYGLEDVCRILAVSKEQLRAMVHAGVCHPSGSGQDMRFGFQDLAALRSAKGLLDANISPTKLRDALRAVSAQLPAQRSVAGLRVLADGQDVLVSDGRTTWRPRSGQTVLSFARDDEGLPTAIRSIAPAPQQSPRVREAREEAQSLFEQALAVEEDDPHHAELLYAETLQRDPQLLDALVNLGRLAYQRKEYAVAIKLYGRALEGNSQDAVAHYNLAMALEDSRRSVDAVKHYQRALEIDERFAEAHFNLARLLERMGRTAQAIRHFSAYKRLTR
jgi:tetratricopeptide (TPR) repeat protein